MLLHKTKELYGHFCTKTQMKSIPGPYWLLDSVTMVKKELLRLLSTDMDVETKLDQLRMDIIGGVLFVTIVIKDDGTKSKSCITILVAPLVVTFTKPVKEHGVLYADVWEELLLHHFKSELDMAVAHCPHCSEPKKSCSCQDPQTGCSTSSMIHNSSLYQREKICVVK
jgi:hypothetical protein